MQETTDCLENIVDIVNAARMYNPSIGYRVKHYVNERFHFSILLSGNAAIEIKRAHAQDGLGSMTPQDIQEVANSYRKLG